MRAIVVNSGNANAFTGLAGDRTVSETVGAAARMFDCPEIEIFVASTGVIGEPVPAEHISSKLPVLHPSLRSDAWADAAQAITTTDTFPKGAVRTARIGDVTVDPCRDYKGLGDDCPRYGNSAWLHVYRCKDTGTNIAEVAHQCCQPVIQRDHCR